MPSPSNWPGRETLGWSAQARQEFTVPEGYFPGPGPDGTGRMGTTFPSRTTQLVVDTVVSGVVPALSEQDRSAVRADVTRWRGSLIVVRASAGDENLRNLVEQVYGPGRQVDDVWIWQPRG